MKRILITSAIALFALSAFAGYYGGGGRSGFSGGRSYSSIRSYSAPRTYSSARTTYVGPRYNRPTYTRPSYTTVSHNYYGHSGFGGGSFFHGFLGGYLGGMMSGHGYGYAAPIVAAGGSQVLPQGQGMLMESGNMVATGSPVATDVLLFIVVGFMFLGGLWLIAMIIIAR